MTRGRVKWFNPDKGYGFILMDGKTEIFVHHTAITGEGFRTLNNEELVDFDLVDTERGFQARNVVRLGLEVKGPETIPSPPKTDDPPPTCSPSL